MKYRAIGKELGLAESTVKEDISRIYEKLDMDALEPSEQLKKLYDTVCPLLKLQATEADKSEATPAEVVEGEVVSEPQEKPGPKRKKKKSHPGGSRVTPAARKSDSGKHGSGFGGLAVGIVLGIGLIAAVVYLALSSLNRPGVSLAQAAPTLPIPVVMPSDTSVPPASPEPATPIPQVIVVTATMPAATEAPTLEPSLALKAYYEDGEWAPLRTGVYAGIHNTFMQDGFAMCSHPVPGFGVFIDIKNDTADGFLLRYDSSGFHAQDDLGNNYPLNGAGIGYCDDGPGPQESQVSSDGTEYISLVFSGQVPLDAKYLVITADSLSGTKVIFHKLY
jgi:hypothetical protein